MRKCPECKSNSLNYYTVEQLVAEGAKPNLGRVEDVWRCETCGLHFDIHGNIRNIYEDYDWREYSDDGILRTQAETFEERWGQ